MLVYLRHGNSSTLFLACVGRGGQVLEAWWSPSDATKEKKEQRSAKLKIKGCSPAARQLASHCIIIKPTGMQLACRLCNLASGSPTGERLASITCSCAFWHISQHIKRESWIFSKGGRKNTTWGTSWRLEELEEPWDLLGIKWGSLERFGYSSFVVVSFSLFFTTLQCTLS